MISPKGVDVKPKQVRSVGLAVLSVSLLAVAACVSKRPREEAITMRQPTANRDPRGNLGEYDPGAAPDSKWVELFADVPNYRRIGAQILGDTEKFRWQFGPMWYRGRLGQNQVKAFVVGQEGAQDENVSNRAFTGSTGTKTQKFLNHLGLYRSYLFLNTFVYTINGQLDKDLGFEFMEQGKGVGNPDMSPLVEYRHRLFDQMLVSNSGSIALFMGVGAGGKASLATWINARGGKCQTAYDMSNCDVSGMIQKFRDGFTNARGERIQADLPKDAKILVIGVPHPGGASQNNGGAAALTNIISGFEAAASRVAAYKTQHSDWLPQDPDDTLTLPERIAAMNGKFEYRDAPVPYRDFDFGTNKRMGADGTTSNRWGSDSIQVFSKYGVYADKSASYSTSIAGKFTADESHVQEAGFRWGKDLPWEPPKSGSSQLKSYDPGPCGHYDNYAHFSEGYVKSPCELSEMMMTGWPEVQAQSRSFGPTSVYRGRPATAKLMVIADQTSHDDFFTGRALSGEAGQRLQSWLNKQEGVGRDYVILRTSPWDALLDDGKIDTAILEASRPRLRQILDRMIRMQRPDRIVAVGAHAQAFARAYAQESKIAYQDLDVSTEALTPIPRGDLPFHSRWWMGTAGNRAVRGSGGQTQSGSLDGKYHYYRVYSPKWSRDYPLPELDPAVATQLKGVMNKLNGSLQ